MSNADIKTNMRLEQKLSGLFEYLERTRGRGHTETLMSGARNQQNNIILMAHTMDYAKQLSKQCLRAKAISWRGFDSRSTRGLLSPLVVDNSALSAILYEAAREINDLRRENQDLRNELERYRQR